MGINSCLRDPLDKEFLLLSSVWTVKLAFNKRENKRDIQRDIDRELFLSASQSQSPMEGLD